MSAGRIILLTISVIILVGLGGVRSWLGQAPAPLRGEAAPARIELRRPREDVILTREMGGPWIVARQDDLADAESIDLLLNGLRSVSFGAPVAAADAGAASGLGPADSTRVRVLDEAGRTLFDGLFGRRLFGRSAYFRASDRDAVRLATGVDPELLLRSAAQWREPRLLPGGCAGGLEIYARGAWRAAPPERARELCDARASHWATGTSEATAGFDRPLLRARVRDGGGFTVGERRGSERLVRVDGRTALLRMPAAAVEAAAADLIGSVR
jgi:hypothetical protein